MRDETSGFEGTVQTPARLQDRVHVLAVYGAFVLIALIVFGTLSHHPF